MKGLAKCSQINQFGYDINVNTQRHAWFQKGRDNPNPWKEEFQCAPSTQATFTPVLAQEDTLQPGTGGSCL
jgi:hypothetical protein